MVSQKILTAQGTLATPVLDQIRDALAPRLAAVGRGFVSYWTDGTPLFCGDVDSSVLLMLWRDLQKEDEPLRRTFWR